jgi:hypothetical protein
MSKAIASFVETDCTIEHQGQTFESGGAVVTAQFIIGYLAENNVLTNWHGNAIGTFRTLSTWRTPRSYVSSTMSSVECFVNGVRYVGRSAGHGMSVRAKRSPRQ